MNVLFGMMLLPILGKYAKGEGKIDQRLIKKVQTFNSSGKLSSIIFSKEKQGRICKECLEEMGVNIVHEFPFINAYAVEVPGSMLEKVARIESIKYISDDIETNSLLDIATQEVGARTANEMGYTGKGIGIAVLDTGVYPHPDLIRPKNRIIAFKDFINNREGPYDDNGHGTFVAGVAAGNGYSSGGRYAGVAPEANIIGVKVMDKDGEGNASKIVAGMQWVLDHKEEYNIKVMCLSIGSQATGSVKNDPLVVASSALWNKGIFVAAAAGNAGPKQRTITTPGVCPSIVTVGAVDDKRTVDQVMTLLQNSQAGGRRGKSGKTRCGGSGCRCDIFEHRSELFQWIEALFHGESICHYVRNIGSCSSGGWNSGPLLEKHPEYTPDDIKNLLLKHARNIDGNIYAQEEVLWIYKAY